VARLQQQVGANDARARRDVVQSEVVRHGAPSPGGAGEARPLGIDVDRRDAQSVARDVAEFLRRKRHGAREKRGDEKRGATDENGAVSVKAAMARLRRARARQAYPLCATRAADPVRPMTFVDCAFRSPGRVIDTPDLAGTFLLRT